MAWDRSSCGWGIEVRGFFVVGWDGFDLSAEVMRKGYSMGRILKRTIQAVRNRFSLDVAKESFFTQLGVRKAYHQLYERTPRPSSA